ncbi:MAG: hypothetical protein RRX93_08480, partial [Bacteroidales bacterium]
MKKIQLWISILLFSLCGIQATFAVNTKVPGGKITLRFETKELTKGEMQNILTNNGGLVDLWVLADFSKEFA